MLKLVHVLVVTLLLPLLAPPAASARWDGKQDNKSEETLEAMTDKEFFNEAFDVCIRRATLERRQSDAAEMAAIITDATDYLGVLYQIVGTKHGGVAPSWMLELTAAHTTKSCQAAFRTFLAGKAPEEEPAEPKPVSRSAKKTAAPRRHGDPLEQLPPWFAPREP